MATAIGSFGPSLLTLLKLLVDKAVGVSEAAEAAPTPTPSETHLEDAFSGSFSTTAALASTCGRRAVDDPLSTVIDFHGEVSNPFEQRTETAETIAMHWWLQVQKTLHALLAMVTGHRNAWTAFSEAHSTALTGLVKRIAAVSDGKQTPTTEASPAAQTPAERVKSMRKALWSPLQSAKEAATRTLRMALLLEGAGPYHKAIDACGIPALCTETLAKLLTRSEVVEAAKARLRHPADPVPSNRQIGLLPYQFWLLEVLHDAIRGPSGSKVLPEIYKTLTETLTQTLQEKGVDEDLDVETVYLAADGVVAEVRTHCCCLPCLLSSLQYSDVFSFDCGCSPSAPGYSGCAMCWVCCRPPPRPLLAPPLRIAWLWTNCWRAMRCGSSTVGVMSCLPPPSLLLLALRRSQPMPKPAATKGNKEGKEERQGLRILLLPLRYPLISLQWLERCLLKPWRPVKSALNCPHHPPHRQCQLPRLPPFPAPHRLPLPPLLGAEGHRSLLAPPAAALLCLPLFDPHRPPTAKLSMVPGTAPPP